MKTIMDFKFSNQGVDRYVMNFTIRDSPRDTINATCWGSEEFIRDLSGSFAIGDVVEVHNAEVRLVSPSNDNLQFKPKASSPFSLTLSESFSSVRLCPAQQHANLEALLNVPLSLGCPLTSLADVLQNGERMKGQHVSVLVSVKKVGVPRQIVSSKTGRSLLKCDVTVFDHTVNAFLIQLWDADWIHYARSWTPHDCVILAHDVRLSYDEFRKSMVATSDGRTVFTVNPDTREALMLYTFTQSVASTGDGAADDCVDLESIHDVYTVEGLRLKLQDAEGAKGPVRGILYVCFTHLDLDGAAPMTSIRCSSCKRMLDAGANRCVNLECSAGAGLETTVPFEQLDVPVGLGDHTGTLERARLRGGVAETLLGCTVQEFQKLSCTQRTLLKWQFLMERVKCYFQASSAQANRQGYAIQLLSVSTVDVQEACVKINMVVD